MFERLIPMIGSNNLEKIASKTVLVVGLGGVGGYAIEGLVRSGITRFIIVDYDTISLSNLNRQIISNHNNIGEYKIDVVEKRILSINPNCQIKKIPIKLNLDNISILFEENFDYCIDACDTISVKQELIIKCLEKDIKIISSMGTGNKVTPLELEIIDIKKTSYDPIAKRIRKYLKQKGITKQVLVVSSKEKGQPFQGNIPSMIFVPAVSGLLCASFVIKDIIKKSN